MQNVLVNKAKGSHFKGGLKLGGSKSLLRLYTKVLEPYFSKEDRSKQVYKDLNHFFWTPVFALFNKLLEQNYKTMKI